MVGFLSFLKVSLEHLLDKISLNSSLFTDSVPTEQILPDEQSQRSSICFWINYLGQTGKLLFCAFHLGFQKDVFVITDVISSLQIFNFCGISFFSSPSL